jgi:hypothetical protein
MNFDYGNLLTRTLQISWKHKSFWGILALPIVISFVLFPFMFGFIYLMEMDLSEGVTTALIIAYFVFLIVFVLALVAFQVLTLSAVNLGILRAERNEGSLKFLDLLKDSIPYFWRQLGVLLIIQLTIGLAFTIFFAFVFFTSVVTMGMASLCLQPIMILLTPLMFLVVGVMESAHTAIFQEDIQAWDAVKRGLNVVREHIWKYVIIIIIVYFGFTIVSSLIFVPMFISFMAFAGLMESGAEFSNQIAIFSIGFTCLIFPIMILFSVFSQLLMKVSLTLTYLRLNMPQQKSENDVIFSETK